MAPETTSDAPTGWQTADVTVHLDATDDLSGVEHTYFSLNHGAAQSGSSVAVTTEGMTLVEFWSVDAAGNVETAQSATVLLDKSAPDHLAHAVAGAQRARLEQHRRRRRLHLRRRRVGSCELLAGHDAVV